MLIDSSTNEAVRVDVLQADQLSSLLNTDARINFKALQSPAGWHLCLYVAHQ